MTNTTILSWRRGRCANAPRPPPPPTPARDRENDHGEAVVGRRRRHPGLPAVPDRATSQAELDRLRVREKAHTREGDAIAAARRRLPMVEVDPHTPLIGADGPVPLIDIFDGRSQLIAYFHMWHTGRPAAEQCEGCTFNTSHITELAYLHSRDVNYAVFGQGPYEEISRYRDFMCYPV